PHVQPTPRGAAPPARPPVIEPLDLLGRAREGREPPQVQFAFDPRHQPIAPRAVAPRVAGARPPFVPRRAAIFQRPTLRFVAPIGHPVPDSRRAHFIITVDRPGFVEHQVRPPRVARQYLLRLTFPQRPILDPRLDPG